MPTEQRTASLTPRPTFSLRDARNRGLVAERRCERCGALFFFRGGRPRFCRRCRPARMVGGRPASGAQFSARHCERCRRSYVPNAWNQKWCASCQPHARRQVDAALYGSSSGHAAARAAIAPTVDAGGVPCVRCGLPIRPGEPWDLDHGDDPRPGHYAGPAHASCNRGAPMKRRNDGGDSPRRTSRLW